MKKVLFKKISGLPEQDTAVGFYRIVQPLRFLKREGICKESRMFPFTGDMETQRLTFNDRTLMAISKNAHAILTTIIWRDDDFLRMLNLRKWSGAKWIVDIDDNLYGVSRDNQGYVNVGLVLPKLERTLRHADGVSVSTPVLKKIYENLNPRVFVNSNGIDFSLTDKHRVKRHKGIRIGWRGSGGHKDDLYIVEAVLRQIKMTYENVEIIVFGFDPKFNFDYEWHEFVGFFDYYEKLASLNLDIGIIPLVDSAYNRGKSNIAFLEYSTLGIPCVISPVENQKGLPGIEANSNYEWYEALQILVESTQKRKELGEKAKKYVKKHYDMKKLIYPYANWIKELPLRNDY